MTTLDESPQHINGYESAICEVRHLVRKLCDTSNFSQFTILAQLETELYKLAHKYVGIKNDSTD